MGEHQLRLWDQMLRAIEACLDGHMNLRDVVGNLEGSLYASELKDTKLIREFHAHWDPLYGPLETAYACSLELGTPFDEKDLERRLRPGLDAMRQFLLDSRERVEAYDPGDY
ncbi:MAG: hypothetical protein GY778_01680 [bacterium]|nr:hypothetical protein [bacterium]